MLLPITFFNKNYYTRFDGINEYVDFGAANSLDFQWNQPHTISSWVNISDGTFSTIVSKQEYSTTQDAGYVFIIGGNTVYYVFRNGISNGISIRTTDILNNNEWYNLTVTYDGSGTANGINIYVNGVISPSIVIFDNMLQSPIIYNDSFKIGARHTPPIQNFDGRLDEISVFLSELTAGVVLDIYNLGRKNINLSTYGSLLSQLRMDSLNPLDTLGVNNGTSINMNNSNIIQYE